MLSTAVAEEGGAHSIVSPASRARACEHSRAFHERTARLLDIVDRPTVEARAVVVVLFKNNLQQSLTRTVIVNADEQSERSPFFKSDASGTHRNK